MEEFLIKYIVDYFFYLPMYVGSRNIGRTLLKNGECITTVERMYVGGVGNFIDVTVPNGFIGCYKYTLKPDFYRSSIFKEAIEELKESNVKYLSELKTQISETEDKINKLNNYL